MLFKNCSNLGLNSSGVQLYSSELMLPCLGVLPFLLILTPFLAHQTLQKHVSNRLNSILIIIHLCLCSIIFHSIEGTHTMTALPLSLEKRKTERMRIHDIANNNKFPKHIITRLEKQIQTKIQLNSKKCDKTKCDNNKKMGHLYIS